MAAAPGPPPDWPPLRSSMAEVKNSFAAPLVGPSGTSSYAAMIINEPTASETLDLKPPGEYKGEPAVFFTREDIESFAQPFKLALVGKFTSGKPPMEELRQLLRTIGFKGSYTVGSIDFKHAILRFDLEEDFQRAYLKGSWNLGKWNMRMFRWSTKWRPAEEPTKCPVWVSFPKLPFHLYNKRAIFSIGNVLGTPLRVDLATSQFSRPSVAKLCVEMDLTGPFPDRLWIDSCADDENFWQFIEYDHIPSYCTNCCRVGHNLKTCKFLKSRYPETQHTGKLPMASNEDTQIWVPVQKQGKNEATTSGLGTSVVHVSTAQANPNLIKSSTKSQTQPPIPSAKDQIPVLANSQIPVPIHTVEEPNQENHQTTLSNQQARNEFPAYDTDKPEDIAAPLNITFPIPEKTPIPTLIDQSQNIQPTHKGSQCDNSNQKWLKLRRFKKTNFYASDSEDNSNNTNQFSSCPIEDFQEFSANLPKFKALDNSLPHIDDDGFIQVCRKKKQNKNVYPKTSRRIMTRSLHASTSQSVFND